MTDKPIWIDEDLKYIVKVISDRKMMSMKEYVEQAISQSEEYKEYMEEQEKRKQTEEKMKLIENMSIDELNEKLNGGGS